jgi:hypothetical protein
MLDSMTCPDGTSVGRDPASSCGFYSCPRAEPQEAEQQEGEPAQQNELTQGEPQQEEAQEALDCPRDIKMCTDLSTVTRNSNCEFEACPEGSCMVDALQCPDGTSVGRDPANSCEFYACP